MLSPFAIVGNVCDKLSGAGMKSRCNIHGPGVSKLQGPVKHMQMLGPSWIYRDPYMTKSC